MFKWLMDRFYYYFSQISPKLIATINDEKSAISKEVKEDLIASILANKPDQLIEQINDKRNLIPEHIKEELLATIGGAEPPLTPLTTPSPPIPKGGQGGALPPLSPKGVKGGLCPPYRGFMIANDSLKAKVDHFLDYTPMFDTGSIPSTHHYFDEAIDQRLSCRQLENKLNVLYNYGNLWSSFEQKQYDPLRVSWRQAMRSHIIVIIEHHLTYINSLKEDDSLYKARYIERELVRILDVYFNIIDKSLLGEKFKTVMVKKLFELITSNGLYSCLSVFKRYRPDLSSDEIYPIINRNTLIYEQL